MKIEINKHTFKNAVSVNGKVEFERGGRFLKKYSATYSY